MNINSNIQFFNNTVKFFNSYTNEQAEKDWFAKAFSESALIFNPNLNPHQGELYSMGKQSTSRLPVSRGPNRESIKESTVRKASEVMRSFRRSVTSLKTIYKNTPWHTSSTESEEKLKSYGLSEEKLKSYDLSLLKFTNDLSECQIRVSQNDKDALWMMGHWFKQRKQLNKAYECFQKAADAGCFLAYSDLANCYKEGYGVLKDQLKADEYYYKAYLAEDAHNYLGPGTQQAGRLFQDGLGGATKDLNKALEIYSLLIDGDTNPLQDRIYNELKRIADNSFLPENRLKALLNIWDNFNPSETGEIRGDNRATYLALQGLIRSNFITSSILDESDRRTLESFISFEKEKLVKSSLTSFLS